MIHAHSLCSVLLFYAEQSHTLHVPGYLPPLDFFKLTPPVPALTDPSKSCSKTFHSRIESNKYLLRIHSFFLFSIFDVYGDYRLQVLTCRHYTPNGPLPYLQRYLLQ